MNSAVMFCDAAPAGATAAATEVQPTGQEGGGGATSSFFGGNMGGIFPIVICFAIFYFMLIRPQQRKEKERRRMIDELRVGAKVVFAGGLMGTVREAKEKTFRVEIAPGTVVEIARGSVTEVIPAEEPKK